MVPAAADRNAGISPNKIPLTSDNVKANAKITQSARASASRGMVTGAIAGKSRQAKTVSP